MANPTQSRFIHPREFDTELQAVWFAANFYYEASFKHRREYSGFVFQKPTGKFALTIRQDGRFHQSTPHLEDMPADSDVRAYWHTHLPASSLTPDPDLKAIMKLFDPGFDNFSRDDRKLAEDLTRQAMKKAGRRFPIYLVTATVIKRYTPGATVPEKTWPKDPPGKMKQIW